jgi:DMSO/TMAO reductase YedYZ heme-binding membrane subunit
VLHYYMIVKTDVIMPLAFAAVTAILLGYRVYANNQKPVDNRKTSVVPK